MTFGRHDVFAVETGRFRLDGGAMFGVVPKLLWSRTNPADEQNRIELALRTLIIKSGDRTILVDTGAGTKLTHKLSTIYAIDNGVFALREGLAQIELGEDSITDVILTHLHFDHAGGAVRVREGAKVPTFRNAKYYVQRAQWDWAQKGFERDRASYFPENYLPLEDHSQLVLLDGDVELFDGIHLHVVNGHTFGQQLVRLEGDGRSMLYCGDLIPTATHIPLPYVMGYDLQPIVTLEEKDTLLQRVVKEDWLLFFEHDPMNECSSVLRNDRGFTARVSGPMKDIAAA